MNPARPLVEASTNGSGWPCFIHIPKNAGNTVRGILRDQYGEDGLVELLLERRLGTDGLPLTADADDGEVAAALGRARIALRGRRCLAVNLPYGVHTSLGVRLRYFTFLREPVERCVSFWYFAYRAREFGGVWSIFEQHDFNVRKIVESGAVPQLVNDQLRFVTGSRRVALEESDLDLAKERIASDFELVGTVEDFVPALKELSRLFAWRPRPFARLNVGDYSDESVLPANARHVFLEANDLDRRLHQWLRETYLPRRLT